MNWAIVFLWMISDFLKNMTTYYSFNVQEPYKTFILNGQKIFEWRLNKWKFKEMQVWDILEFEETHEKLLIKSKKNFSTFKEMIEFCNIEKIIPDAKILDEAINVYYKFYTKEQEKEFWVIAIEIEIQK